MCLVLTPQATCTQLSTGDCGTKRDESISPSGPKGTPLRFQVLVEGGPSLALGCHEAHLRVGSGLDAALARC